MTADDTGSLVSRITSGLQATLIARVLWVGSNVLLITLLTRIYLSPSGFGRLFFALSILGVVRVFASLGLPKSTARYVNEFAETDESQIRHVLRASVLVTGGIVGTASVVLAAASGALADLLGQPDVAPLLLVGAAYVSARSATGYLKTLFQGFNRVTMSAVLTSISSVGRVGFGIGLVAAGFGAVGVLAGYVLGNVLASAVGAVVLYRDHYTQFDRSAEPEPGLSRRLLEYSIPLTVTKGANALDKRVDSVLVGTLLNPAAVGFYVIGKQVSDVLSAPAASFGFTVSPAYNEQKASDQQARAARLYEQALRYVLIFYIPACAGLVLVAEPTVRFVFGREYLPAVRVVQVFAGFVLVNAVNKITNDGLDYLGRARSRAYIQTGTAVGNVVLNVLLIPTMGVVGAAVATVCTYTVLTAGNVYFIDQELSIRLARLARDVAVVCLIAAVMAGAVLVAMPHVSGPITLAGVVVLGGGVWAVLTVLSGVVDFRRLVSILT
ncbi:flippase [Halobaculum litoreum]|uniref:Flippase n=1 Tax=Halobaculum litoreum TaxID=3031998 RepID=A0ABD5XU88_9EURY